MSELAPHPEANWLSRRDQWHAEAADAVATLTQAGIPPPTPDMAGLLHLARVVGYAGESWGVTPSLIVEHVLVWRNRLQLTATLSAPAMPEKVKSPGGSNKKGGKATINTLMLQIIHNDPTAAGWPQRKWAKRLNCSPSGVAGTHAWRVVLKLAAALEAADRTTSSGSLDNSRTSPRGRQIRRKY